MQAGFTKDFTAKQSLNVLGTTMSQSTILSDLAAGLALLTNVAQGRNALATQVAAKTAGLPAFTKLFANLETALKAQFGPGNPELQDFGIAPPKAKKQLTAEEKALSAANAKATKKVRGIIGKNERSQITTSGKPGLVLVGPDGTVVPGGATGPLPPGSATPLAIQTAPASGVSAPATVPAAVPGSSTGSGNGQ